MAYPELIAGLWSVAPGLATTFETLQNAVGSVTLQAGTLARIAFALLLAPASWQEVRKLLKVNSKPVRAKVRAKV